MDMAAVWGRIASWHEVNTPAGTLRLAPGASEEDITAFEREVGFRLPDDLRASFALHNGSEGTFLLWHGELLSLEGIAQTRREYLWWQEQEGWGAGEDYEMEDIVGPGPIKPLWWTPLRLPLTDNSGDHVLADFDPAEGGQRGQIIANSHETGPSRVRADTFAEWLLEMAEGLESGKYVYVQAEMTVAPPGMWE